MFVVLAETALGETYDGADEDYSYALNVTMEHVHKQLQKEQPYHFMTCQATDCVVFPMVGRTPCKLL
jgi:hypothetical protein